MTDSKIKSAKKLLLSSMLPRDIANDLGISIATLYRWMPGRKFSCLLGLNLQVAR